MKNTPVKFDITQYIQLGYNKADLEKYRVSLMELMSSDSLKGVNQASIVREAFRLVELGLNPNPLLGEAFVMPYNIKENGVTVDRVAKLSISVKGYSILGHRVGWTFRGRTVYKVDDFEVKSSGFDEEYVLSANYEERNEEDPKWLFENLIGIIAFAKDEKGEVHSRFINRKKLEKIRLKNPKQNANYLSHIWAEWPEEMYIKSALKYHIKRLPVESNTLAKAITFDEEIERGDVCVVPDDQRMLPGMESEIVPTRTTITQQSISDGKGIAYAVNNMGLSFYLFEDKIIVDGNTFSYSKALKDLGFKCYDGEWYIDTPKDFKDTLGILLPDVKFEVKKNESINALFYGAKEPKDSPYADKLIELGFAYSSGKGLWIKKEVMA